MDTYKIFMLIALPVLGLAWIGYAIWLHKVRKAEEGQPKVVSERLTKSRNEMSDWAQKMKGHKSPREQALDRRRKLDAERKRKESEQTED